MSTLNISDALREARQRRDNFALNAPPVPDWYMPAPMRESYDAWIAGAGRETVKKLKDDLTSEIEQIRHGFTGHSVVTGYKFAEELRAAIKKAYAEYAEKKDAEIRGIIATRTVSWRVYFADELIAALDKDRVAQNCRTCKHESAEMHHAPCDVCLYEEQQSGRLPNWEPKP